MDMAHVYFLTDHMTHLIKKLVSCLVVSASGAPKRIENRIAFLCQAPVDNLDSSIVLVRNLQAT